MCRRFVTSSSDARSKSFLLTIWRFLPQHGSSCSLWSSRSIGGWKSSAIWHFSIRLASKLVFYFGSLLESRDRNPILCHVSGNRRAYATTAAVDVRRIALPRRELPPVAFLDGAKPRHLLGVPIAGTDRPLRRRPRTIGKAIKYSVTSECFLSEIKGNPFSLFDDCRNTFSEGAFLYAALRNFSAVCSSRLGRPRVCARRGRVRAGGDPSRRTSARSWGRSSR